VPAVLISLAHFEHNELLTSAMHVKQSVLTHELHSFIESTHGLHDVIQALADISSLALKLNDDTMLNFKTTSKKAIALIETIFNKILVFLNISFFLKNN